MGVAADGEPPSAPLPRASLMPKSVLYSAMAQGQHEGRGSHPKGIAPPPSGWFGDPAHGRRPPADAPGSPGPAMIDGSSPAARPAVPSRASDGQPEPGVAPPRRPEQREERHDTPTPEAAPRREAPGS